MDQSINYASNIEGRTFTFLVGSEEQVFMVHENAISKHSEVLHRLMKAPMKEANERLCRLPDIKYDTFRKFASFCYFDNYPTEPKTIKDSGIKEDAAMENCASIALGFGKVDDCHGFYCYRCGHLIDADCTGFMFPYCSASCANGMGRKDFYCTTCGKIPSDSLGMVCEPCVFGYRGILPVDINIFKSAVIRLTELRFDAMMKRYATCYSMIVETRTRLGVRTASNDLKGHIEAFVLAELYDVPALKALSLTKLAFDLSRTEITSGDVPDVVELMELTYENTVALEGPVKSDGVALRRIVTTFAVQHYCVLVGHESFKVMMRQGGEVVDDILDLISFYGIEADSRTLN